MDMINVTNIRRNIRGVLSEISKTKKPVAIIQRSRPVAYLIDAESFDRLQNTGKPEDLLTKNRLESLERISLLRAKIAQKRGTSGNSTRLIRNLREGQGRDE